MKCNYCSHENPDAARFCNGCGAALHLQEGLRGYANELRLRRAGRRLPRAHRIPRDRVEPMGAPDPADRLALEFAR